ncbi:uncharacterized protein LODBEIA_P08580 [Lodderomyces beijingensis]|uniref:Bud22 domain-containing protein n=1 Tax=Lodderomyces beijingensis TaxID=1775926 RepID=A0ABP0ZFL6_9ASCO
MKNTNQMWKLDLLEAKFENLPPRFPHTKRLLLALNHNNKLAKKLPSDKASAISEIAEMKTHFFENKYHSGFKKLEKEVKKLIKSKNNAPEIFQNDEFLNHLITSRLIKSITATILISKEASKSNPPSYIPQHIRDIITNKSNPSNPSQFFITHCQDSKEVNNYCSSLWNSKNIKSLLDDIDWSFKTVRGNLTHKDLEERSRQTNKPVSSSMVQEEDKDDDKDEDDDESGSSDEEVEEAEEDAEAAFEKYAEYDNLVGASDAEDDDNDDALNPEINYNEVTDEEPSDDESGSDSSDSADDFFEQEEEQEEPPRKKTKKEKQSAEAEYNLPELATGYYSGGSDDEDENGNVDNDRVVKELTLARKNRRGQRARQKIWAKKYGKEAKHVKKDQEKVKSERETRQREYEERQRKRELRAKLAAEREKPTGANMEPLGERKSVATSNEAEKSIHPSWEAKKQAEAKMKNVKFQGKKITFD